VPLEIQNLKLEIKRSNDHNQDLAQRLVNYNEKLASVVAENHGKQLDLEEKLATFADKLDCLLKHSEERQKQTDENAVKHDELQTKVKETESKNEDLEKTMEEMLKMRNWLVDLVKTNATKQKQADKLIKENSDKYSEVTSQLNS
jgi:predicted RNase H-like nuclease (RuvC/YqgF family)